MSSNGIRGSARILPILRRIGRIEGESNFDSPDATSVVASSYVDRGEWGEFSYLLHVRGRAHARHAYIRRGGQNPPDSPSRDATSARYRSCARENRILILPASSRFSLPLGMRSHSDAASMGSKQQASQPGNREPRANARANALTARRSNARRSASRSSARCTVWVSGAQRTAWLSFARRTRWLSGARRTPLLLAAHRTAFLFGARLTPWLSAARRTPSVSAAHRTPWMLGAHATPSLSAARRTPWLLGARSTASLLGAYRTAWGVGSTSHASHKRADAGTQSQRDMLGYRIVGVSHGSFLACEYFDARGNSQGSPQTEF
jgi:hypothetical protein